MIFTISISAVVIVKRFSEGGGGIPSSFQARWGYVVGALRMIADSPILGVGYGSFKYAYPKFMENDVLYDTIHAHNIFLQFWAELGIFGFILIAWFFWAAVKAGIRKVKEVDDGADKILKTALFCAVLSAIIHNSLDFDFYDPSTSFHFFVFLGLLI